MKKRATAPTDRYGLSLSPQDVRGDTWYYEEPRGILVVHEVRDESGGLAVPTRQFRIPWRMLQASLERKVRGKRAKPRKAVTFRRVGR